jgi:hypothetical protein
VHCVNNLTQISPLDLMRILSAYKQLGIDASSMLTLAGDYIKRRVTQLPPQDLARFLMALARVRFAAQLSKCILAAVDVPPSMSHTLSTRRSVPTVLACFCIALLRVRFAR